MENSRYKFRAWNAFSEIMVYGPKLTRCPVVAEAYDDQGMVVELPLMQYTGLTDKNGVEIYELHEVNNIYRVVFGDGRYVLQEISNGDIFMPLSTTTVEAYELKVTREYAPMEKN